MEDPVGEGLPQQANRCFFDAYAGIAPAGPAKLPDNLPADRN
jgi:hypothetical protein